MTVRRVKGKPTASAKAGRVKLLWRIYCFNRNVEGRPRGKAIRRSLNDWWHVRGLSS